MKFGADIQVLALDDHADSSIYLKVPLCLSTASEGDQPHYSF